MTNVDLAGIL